MSSSGGIAVQILGGAVIAACGLIPFLGLNSPVGQESQHVTTHKPVLKLQESSPLIPEVTTAVIEETVPSISEPQVMQPEVQETNESAATRALLQKVELLNRGVLLLREIQDYTGKLQKQEVVHGILQEEQTISMKCRHNPFSLYLIWHTGATGREVIYIEGQNNGNMIVHEGGWKSRLPALTLATDCFLAMRDARYPVTTAGLLGLIEMMLRVHQDDLLHSNYVSCEIDPNRQFEGRPCTMFTTKYRSPIESPTYRKSITLIDQEWNVPLHSRHFEWLNATSELDEETLDEQTLIECYSFTEINMGCGLTDHDFDRANQEYNFR